MSTLVRPSGVRQKVPQVGRSAISVRGVKGVGVDLRPPEKSTDRRTAEGPTSFGFVEDTPVNEQSSNGKRKLGAAISRERNRRGLTLGQVRRDLIDFGLEKGHSISHLSAVENGDAWPSRDLVAALEQIFECDGALLPLLRDAKVPSTRRSTQLEYEMTTFFAGRVAQQDPSDDEPVRVVSTAHGLMRVYASGVAVLPVTMSDMRADNLTDVARFRAETLARRKEYLVHALQDDSHDVELIDDEPYGLTCITLRKAIWADLADIDDAVRVLSCPSVLIGSTGPEHAEQHETNLMRRAKEILDIECFSVPGSHLGHATWSGVAIYPEVDSEILENLHDLQLELQSLWCYASYCSRFEVSSPNYGTAFLKSRLRAISIPRPTEHIGQRLLRDALIKTSRIEAVISSAAAALEVEK
jgi:hypothetical protein